MILHTDEIEAEVIGKFRESQGAAWLSRIWCDEDSKTHGLAVVHNF
jgi:hypothetical protein